jgi:HD-GYP domain-containing protein (c-di-GMP phosphodiesterase class II)
MFAEISDLFLARESQTQSGPLMAHWLVALSRLTDLAEGRPLRHAMRVAMVAYHIGKLLTLNPNQQSVVVQTALLHDVGVLAVLPNLAKALPPILGEKTLLAGHRAWQHGLTTWPVTLTESSRKALWQHTQQARKVLLQCRLDPDVIAGVTATHEQWNGQGYPYGQAADAIPMQAQIAALADLLEGLMTPNLTPAQREQHIRAVFNAPSRTHWNPDLLALITGPFFEDPWWYRDIFSTEAEVMQLLPQDPLHPGMILGLSRLVGEWTEAMAPDYWHGHSQRVAELAQTIAGQLNVNASQKGQLIMAGLWHEAGKLAWPLPLWLKPDPYTQAEWQLAMDHPQLAADIITVIPGCQDIASWIAEHHERMNGSGYPGGRKGVHISIAGRLLAMCDAYDALTHPRPYRPMPYSVTEALSLMSEQRNRLFDANLFGIFRDTVMQQTTVFSQLQPLQNV